MVETERKDRIDGRWFLAVEEMKTIGIKKGEKDEKGGDR